MVHAPHPRGFANFRYPWRDRRRWTVCGCLLHFGYTSQHDYRRQSTDRYPPSQATQLTERWIYPMEFWIICIRIRHHPPQNATRELQGIRPQPKPNVDHRSLNQRHTFQLYYRECLNIKLHNYYNSPMNASPPSSSASSTASKTPSMKSKKQDSAQSSP